MTPTERALETLKAGQAEITATIELRGLQSDSIVGLSAVVMPILNEQPEIKGKFLAALRARGTALDSFHRGLFVASLSAFEGFVKQLISALAQQKVQAVSKFSELPETFQNQYISRAAQVLSHVGSGTVKGVPYNFTGLRDGFGKCLSDATKPPLNGEVYTLLMGNPTWGRLQAVLGSLGIDAPFDQAFGSNEHMRKWGKAGWKQNLAAAETMLDGLIDMRNLIVHASSPVTVVEGDVTDACSFFTAFGQALAEELPPRL